MDAVGAIGGAGDDAIEEDDLVAPFLDLDRGVGGVGQTVGERGQLVIVGGEQDAGAVDLVQIFERGPGDGEPVEGRGASADLVEHDEGALARLIEDGGGLDHLDHEGGAAAGEIVGGADAAEQPIDDADMGLTRRHEGTGLGEHDDQARSGGGRSTCRPCSAR